MHPSAKAACQVGLVLLLVPLAGACGGDDAPPPNADVSGSWSGTWRSDGGTEGTLGIVFSDRRPGGMSRDVYDVSLVVRTDSCEDHAVGDDSAATVENTATASVLFPQGAAGFALLSKPTFDFHGTVEGEQVQGTYQLRNTSACSFCPCGLGTAGTWSVAR